MSLSSFGASSEIFHGEKQLFCFCCPSCIPERDEHPQSLNAQHDSSGDCCNFSASRESHVRVLYGSPTQVLNDVHEDTDLPGVKAGAGKPNKWQVFLGFGSLAIGVIDAVCLFFVTANSLVLLLGGASISLAQGAVLFHTATIRLPLLSLATLGAVLNLWLLFNAWRLRRAPSALWRRRPLDRKERRRIIIVSALSIITLLVVATELFLHHRLHGSSFARAFNPSARIERNFTSV
jgi:hypothetical protein